MRKTLSLVVASVLALAVPALAGAAVRLVQVAGSLDQPVHVTAVPGGGGLAVVEQPGRVVVLRLGGGGRSTLLDIRDRVLCCGEQGLLSVAFHPRYPDDPRFFVNYTNRSGDTEVVEFTRGGGERLLLRVEQPYSNHNGGQIAFGPDGRLYVGMGDGGSGGDPEDRAQDMNTLLGKLVRLDVDEASPSAAIAALGLRNPWRFTFDRPTGDFYAGDVGQGNVEEVDYAAGGVRKLLNFGWDRFEGRSRFEDTPLGPGELRFPIAAYDHSGGRCSITGGVVYRGAKIPTLRGRYLYGDYCSGEIWSLKVVAGKAVGKRKEPFRLGGLSSFGLDAAGEAYLVSVERGGLYRVVRR